MAEETKGLEAEGTEDIAKRIERLALYEDALFSIVSLSIQDAEGVSQEQIRAALEHAGLPDYFEEAKILVEELQSDEGDDEGTPNDGATDEDEEVQPTLE